MLNDDHALTRSDAENLNDAQGTGASAARGIASRHPPQRTQAGDDGDQRNDERDQARAVAGVRVGRAGDAERTQQEKHHITAK